MPEDQAIAETGFSDPPFLIPVCIGATQTNGRHTDQDLSSGGLAERCLPDLEGSGCGQEGGRR
jgi:hypothetical protein